MMYRVVCVLLLGGLLSLSGCAVLNIQQPQVQIDAVDFEPRSLQQGQLNALISVANPNQFSVPIKGLNYQITLNGEALAMTSTKPDIKLAAGDTQQMTIPIVFDYSKLLKGINRIFKSQTVQFQLKGDVDFGLVTVPFSKTGEFKLGL